MTGWLLPNPPPPSPPFFPNVSERNFEIDFFLVIQRSDNKKSGVDTATQDPGAGIVSYALEVYMVLMEGMVI